MRKTWNLNRDWRFRHDIDETQKALSHAEAYMFTQAGSAGGMAAVHYDDSDWSLVQLPHDYAVDGDFSADNLLSHGYRGASNAWYRKRFCLPEEYRNKHILLTFGGIAMKARIYCNGSLMARSFTAYTPTVVDLTGRAFFGDRANTLAVEADGYSLEGWFYEGAGIYRDVKLYAKDLLHLAHEGIFWKPVCGRDGWVLHWEALVENSDLTCPVSAPFVLCAALSDADGQIVSGSSEVQVCPAGETIRVSGDLPVPAPHLWDVDDPYLYTARMTLTAADGASDAEETSIGFRTFTADSKRGFLLNGRPIKLKGTCNHQDHAGVGTAIPEAVWEYRLSLLKELGSNAYRCSHNMPDEILLSLCDRMGMLVIDEPRHFESGEEAFRQAEALARQARNHPSVVMYSLFNEEALQSTAEGCHIYRKLRHAISRWDDSRLFTGALGGGALDPAGTALLMDVTGINYSLPIAEKFHELYPDQPVFGSESNSSLSTRGCFVTDAEKHVCAGYDEDFVPWGNRTRDNWQFAASHDWYGGICV
ncbi:MAG: beta-galactosidase, partial [Clostridia bacterium]|nr:beta-galactosidase [Clostridia bacterium]